MINWDKINKKINVKKYIAPVFIFILIILVVIYLFIINRFIQKSIFANEMERIATQNEQQVFSIEKIYVCSSANAKDNSEEGKLENLDIYQYSDLAVYINNFRDNGLNNQNTVKQLYIDNINLTLDNESGITDLYYTNLYKIGSKDEIKDNLEQTQRIDFKIVNTNQENNQADYSEPVFYADCSNPITLKYVNKLNKQYTLNKSSSANFDGSILKKANISIEDLNCNISFKINIINNQNDYNYAWVSFRIPLNDIYQGTSIKNRTVFGKEFDFFKF